MQIEGKVRPILFSTLLFVLGVGVENALTGPITLLSFIVWVPLAIAHVVTLLTYLRADMPWLARCVSHLVVYVFLGTAFVWLMASRFNSLNLESAELVENGALTQAGWLHYLPIIAMYACMSLVALLVISALLRAFHGQSGG